MSIQDNVDVAKGNMKSWLGQAKQKWALLGDDDFKLYGEGKVQEFAGKIQAAYGKSRIEAEKEVKEFKESCGCSSSDQAA